MAGLWISEIANSWLITRFPLLIGGNIAVPIKMAYFMVLVFAVTIVGGLIPALYVTRVDLIAEDGAYDALMEKNGIFADLVRRQMVTNT